MPSVRKATEKDIPKILELLVQVDMVHHLGRPDIFKGPVTKYGAEELKVILQDDKTPVFVCVDENDVPLGHAFCIHKQELGSSVLTDIKALYIDGDVITSFPAPFKPQEKFLALPFRLYDVHMPDAGETVAEHGDIGHGGKLQKYVRAGIVKFRHECRYIRAAVLQQEHLPAAFAAAGRVQEYHVRPEGAEDFRHGHIADGVISDGDVIGPQYLEIVPCSSGKGRVHLVVKHGRCNLGKRPCINSKAACKVCNPFG